VIFIGEGQDTVRSRVQAVKAIVQSKVSALGRNISNLLFRRNSHMLDSVDQHLFKVVMILDCNVFHLWS
jgi:hypothetical protein